MTTSPSSRSDVDPFHAMDVLAEANRRKALGEPVISLAVGQPGDPAPEKVMAAARAALDDGRIGYTDALGIAELRSAVAQHYVEHYGVEVPVSHIAITTGSSAAFNLAFLAMFDPGDRVAITAPGYPAYRNILRALGLEVVEIPLTDAPYLTADAMKAVHDKTPLSGVLFASPANPTGSIMPENVLKDVLASARKLGIQVISDEIYHRLNFVGPDITVAGLDRDAVIINSFSKYYCMTGWRIGWMVVPDNLVRAIERLQQNLYISAPEISQKAAVAAFDSSDHLDTVRSRYIENRNLLMDRLPKAGFRLVSPMDGAFYAYCDVSSFTNDSMVFARMMLAETSVAATPGLDFDPEQGHRTMRFSYAGKPEEIAEAMDRLDAWLRN